MTSLSTSCPSRVKILRVHHSVLTVNRFGSILYRLRYSYIKLSFSFLLYVFFCYSLCNSFSLTACTKSSQQRMRMDKTDTKFSWFILTMVTFIVFLEAGTIKAFAVLLPDLKEHLSSQTWIIGSCISIIYGLGYVIGKYCQISSVPPQTPFYLGVFIIFEKF